VLVVSEELDELFDICDRLYVMAKGQLSPSLARDQASTALVGQWMSGLWEPASVRAEPFDVLRTGSVEVKADTSTSSVRTVRGEAA
jgi:ABC-type multidrug transport system ATPase subunit